MLTSAYVLGLADDALVSAQRMGWWISRAPELEEDVALANIGLDQLGQARSLLAHAGRLEDEGRGEDDLAYLRDERDFRCVHLVERVQTDFGVAMARLLIFATYQAELYAALLSSTDETLVGVAGKAVKEVAYHVDHATHWVLRLGDGTPESHERMQRALDAEWPFVEELFEPVDATLVASGVAADPTVCALPCSSAWRPWSAEAHAHPARGRAADRRRPPEGCTPRTSATCSPRCSTSPARTRGRHGDRHARHAATGPGP